MSRHRVKPRFGSAADASRRTGLSVRTIRRLIAAGELAFARVGRRVLLDLAEVDRRCAGAGKSRAEGPAGEPTAPAAESPGPDPDDGEDWGLPI